MFAVPHVWPLIHGNGGGGGGGGSSGSVQVKADSYTRWATEPNLAECYISFGADGILVSYAYTTVAGWTTYPWLLSGSRFDFEIRFTELVGVLGSGYTSGANVWVPLSGGSNYGVTHPGGTPGSTSVTGLIEIRHITSLEVMASANVTITARVDAETGGGGGGGGGGYGGGGGGGGGGEHEE